MIVIIPFALFLGGCGLVPPVERSANPLEDTAKLRWNACYAAQQKIKSALKAPSTADFPNCYEADSEAHVDPSDVGPGAYTVATYVDAQNSFGAKLRGYYSCASRTFDGETFQAVCLETNADHSRITGLGPGE